MNSDELWDTTMDPSRRTLVQLTTDDLMKTRDLFNTLMGSDSSKRREYIMENVEEMI